MCELYHYFNSTADFTRRNHTSEPIIILPGLSNLIEEYNFSDV